MEPKEEAAGAKVGAEGNRKQSKGTGKSGDTVFFE